MSKNEKYFLNSLRYASCHAALSLSLRAYNRNFTIHFAALAHPN